MLVGLAFKWLVKLWNGFAGLLLWLRAGWVFLALWLVILAGVIVRGGLDNLTHIWYVLILGTCLVITEMLNTAIERLCNFIEPNKNNEIKVVKDICAGAVLVSGLALITLGSWFIVRG